MHVTSAIPELVCGKDCMLQNMKLVENVRKLAAKKGVTAGQMALAWLQHQVQYQCHI